MGKKEREEQARRRAEFDQMGAAFAARDADSAMKVIEGIKTRNPALADQIMKALATKARAKAN